MQGTGQGHYPWPTWRLSYDSQYSPSFAFIPPDQYSLPSQPGHESPQSSPTVIEPTDDGTDTVTAAANQVSGR